MRGSFKPTAAVYQLEIPSLKAESPFEPSISLSPRFDAKHSTPTYSEIRSEIHPTIPLGQRGKGPLEGSLAFKIPSYLQLNFPTLPNSEECVTHSFLTLVGFPDFVSCKSLLGAESLRHIRICLPRWERFGKTVCWSIKFPRTYRPGKEMQEQLGSPSRRR
jgi:hypothetical protein